MVLYRQKAKASSAFFVYSYWRTQEYINADDAIAFCLYLTNKMRGETSLQWPPLYNRHYNGTECCLIKLPFWWPHVSRLAAQESFTHSPVYTGLGEWVKLMSQSDFMCAMMSIISSMVRTELSQPFLCILIEVHRNISTPMMPLPFVFISWIKCGGKPLCNGHLFIKAIFFCPAGGLIGKSFNCICIVPNCR